MVHNAASEQNKIWKTTGFWLLFISSHYTVRFKLVLKTFKKISYPGRFLYNTDCIKEGS